MLLALFLNDRGLGYIFLFAIDKYTTVNVSYVGINCCFLPFSLYTCKFKDKRYELGLCCIKQKYIRLLVLI